MNKYKTTLEVVAFSVALFGLSACSNKKATQAQEKLPTFSQISKMAKKNASTKYKSLSLYGSLTGGKKKPTEMALNYIVKPSSGYIMENDKGKKHQFWVTANKEVYIASDSVVFKTKNKALTKDDILSDYKEKSPLKSLYEVLTNKDNQKLKWKISESKGNYVLTYNVKNPAHDMKQLLSKGYDNLNSSDSKINKYKDVKVKFVLSKKGVIKSCSESYDLKFDKENRHFNSKIEIDNLKKIQVPKKVKEKALDADELDKAFKGF